MIKYTLAENKKYYAKLPKKRISVGALFFNNKNELLIVEPNYKNNWLIVGGTVDKNESPYTAIKREIKEEIGLTPKNLKLVCVEYKTHQDYRIEAIYFLFYGGVLKQKQIDSIKIQKSELEKYKFINIKEAIKILSTTTGDKLPYCIEAIKNKKLIYLENGKTIK